MMHTHSFGLSGAGASACIPEVGVALFSLGFGTEPSSAQGNVSGSPGTYQTRITRHPKMGPGRGPFHIHFYQSAEVLRPSWANIILIAEIAKR